jgi:hypothetical protein
VSPWRVWVVGLLRLRGRGWAQGAGRDEEQALAAKAMESRRLKPLLRTYEALTPVALATRMGRRGDRDKPQGTRGAGIREGTGERDSVPTLACPAARRALRQSATGGSEAERGHSA